MLCRLGYAVLCFVACNLVAVSTDFGQTVAPPYASAYTLFNLGTPAGVPGSFGGLTFKAGDPNTLLIGGSANGTAAKLYAIQVTRDAQNHVVGFAGTATVFANANSPAGGIDGGLTYGPGGVLFYTSYSDNYIGQIKPGSAGPDKLIQLTALGVASSVGTLTFTPAGFPGAGQFKIASFNASTFYGTTITPDGAGTFDINAPSSSVSLGGGGPEGIIYVPIGSTLFPNPSLLLSEYSSGRVSTFEVDANGNPNPATRADFITGLSGAEGAVLDPLTNDFLFSTFGGGNSVFVVQGFNTPVAGLGPIAISEFRLSGPSSENDEFIEIANNTNAPIIVTTTDGSAGWTLVGADGAARFTIPNTTVLPARGHYLGCNNNGSGGYSLAAYATCDATYTTSIANNTGVALFQTADPTNFTLANRLDAVGFNPGANALYRSGTGLTPININTAQYSFVRKLTTGLSQSTGDNAQDFVLVSQPDGPIPSIRQKLGGSVKLGGIAPVPVLGAPGPEGLASPIQRNAQIAGSLIDPQCTNSGLPTSACARARDTTPVGNGQFGTLSIRRTFTNNTGQPVTRLRFRVVDITTLGNQTKGEADLRLLNSPVITVTRTDNTPVTVQGLTIEEPPTQASGGGLNSTVAAGIITTGTPLAPGASINVHFLLGVQQAGAYRIFVNIEALP